MAYSNQAIQSDFSRYQQAGLKGSLARSDNGVWYYDTADVADGVTIQPGQGVYLDSDGFWILPTQSGDELLVTHVAAYEATDLNVNYATADGNQLSHIAYVGGDDSGIGVKAFAVGPVYLEAESQIIRGDSLAFNETGEKVATITAAGTSKLVMIALDNAQADDVFPVRITARVA